MLSSKAAKPFSFDEAKVYSLLQAGKNDKLADELMEALFHLDNAMVVDYAPFKQTAEAVSNALIKVFSDERFELSEKKIIPFINCNMLISNIMFCANRNGDEVIKAIAKHQNNLPKILVFYSLRSEARLPLEDIFAAAPVYASVWWCSVVAYAYTACSEQVNANREYFSSFSKLELFKLNGELIKESFPYRAHLYSTCVNEKNDVAAKKAINAEIKRLFNVPANSYEADKKKIAIYSHFFIKGHAVYKSIAPLLYGLKGSYHLTHINTNLGNNAMLDKELFDNIVNFGSGGSIDFSELAKFMQKEKINILIFPEVGLNSTSIIMANLRLAPIQIACYGHPVTTGSTEIDYFICGRDVEDEANLNKNYI